MIFSSLLILFLWIRSILVLRLFCLFLLSLSQKDNRAFADGNFIEDAIIFHISRVWGKGKFICWREIMTFFFLLLLLPFLVVTFHSHTINIIIFLLCMLWERKKSDLWFPPISMSMCYTTGAAISTLRCGRAKSVGEEEKINHNYRFWKSDKLLFTLRTIVLVYTQISFIYMREGWKKNSFIDIDVKIISDSLDRYLSNEIDNMMCVYM